MKLSTSWETASRPATKDFANILRKSNVHHSVHKSSPLVPTPIQIKSVHNTSGYYSKIHFNIILPAMCRYF
jgi:hypothetical protein